MYETYTCRTGTFVFLFCFVRWVLLYAEFVNRFFPSRGTPCATPAKGGCSHREKRDTLVFGRKENGGAIVPSLGRPRNALCNFGQKRVLSIGRYITNEILYPGSAGKRRGMPSFGRRPPVVKKLYIHCVDATTSDCPPPPPMCCLFIGHWPRPPHVRWRAAPPWCRRVVARTTTRTRTRTRAGERERAAPGGALPAPAGTTRGRGAPEVAPAPATARATGPAPDPALDPATGQGIDLGTGLTIVAETVLALGGGPGRGRGAETAGMDSMTQNTSMTQNIAT